MELSDLIFAVCGKEEREKFAKASAIIRAHELKMRLLDEYVRHDSIYHSEPCVLSCAVRFNDDGETDDRCIAVKPREYMEGIGCDDDSLFYYLDDLSDVFRLMMPDNGEDFTIVEIHSFLL